MRCPIDGTDLQIAVRSGVEIDFCPQCKGVWLDRGELEKLMDREADAYADFDRDPSSVKAKRKNDEIPVSRPEPRPTRQYSDDDDDDDYRDSPRKRRRGSFLGELFDIFD